MITDYFEDVRRCDNCGALTSQPNAVCMNCDPLEFFPECIQCGGRKGSFIETANGWLHLEHLPNICRERRCFR